MDIRCVVTGQNASGKSLIMRDAGVQPVSVALLPGYEFHRVWGSESVPELPSDGAAPKQPRYFPAKNGFRFGFFTLPPATKTRGERIVTASALEEMQEKLPGMMDVLEPDHPGMHMTDTVDFDVVISGEVYLKLDDGAEVLLKAGDCVIQNGTRHAWHNRSAEKCVIAVTLVGAERESKLVTMDCLKSK
jgi:mannose-6-phosphate isomerase-like protein (cupin superfamily)